MKAVPSPVLSCCTSYKFRSSLPLPPNARLLSGSRERLGIRKGLCERGYQSGWLPPTDARGRGAGQPVLPWTSPAGCSSPAPSASCPVSTQSRSCTHPNSPGKGKATGNNFCLFGKGAGESPRLIRLLLEKSCQKQEGGSEAGAFEAGEGELKGMEIFDGLPRNERAGRRTARRPPGPPPRLGCCWSGIS